LVFQGLKLGKWDTKHGKAAQHDAGRVALRELQAVGVLAILYAHTSARIGEAQDGLDNGVVNGLNALALAHGLQLGMRVSDAVRHLGG
jgi:hypothetical protein